MTQTSRGQTARFVLLLGALTALGPLSIDMYLPSFPALAESLGTSVASVQLTLAAYLAGLALGQIVYGPLSDRLGRRGPLITGLLVYAGASLVCAISPSLPLLVAARFLQALGGCAGLVISRAIVRDRFDERGSANIYSTLMLVMGLAPILAPTLGGQVLLIGGWRSIFVTLSVVGVGIAALVGFGLRESLPVDARNRRGVRGTLREFLIILRDGHFVRLALAGGAVQGAMFAYISGSPFVFIELFGVAPERYGIIFGMNAFGLIAASQLNRLLVRRFGVVGILRSAVLVSAAGSLVLWAAARSGAGLEVLVGAIFIVLATVGLVLPNATAAAMAPHGRRAGLASALLGTMQSACGAVAAIAVSALANGTAGPMTTVMFAATGLALVLVTVDLVAMRAERTSLSQASKE